MSIGRDIRAKFVPLAFTLCVAGSGTSSGVIAQSTQSPSAAAELGPKYDDAIVAKAEAILRDAGMNHAGKLITSTETSAIAKQISGLTRQRRELRKAQDLWRQAHQTELAMKEQMRQLNRQHVEISQQMAAAGVLDLRTHNRLVASSNAIGGKLSEIQTQIEQAEKVTGEQAAGLRQAEADYAKEVLAIRDAYDALAAEVGRTLTRRDVQIAVSVMHRNFETPAAVTADVVLGPLLRRLEKIEGEVFQELIELENDGGSLMASVVVGDRTVQMVVDSGATIVSLPAQVAQTLGIVISQDAPRMNMILADGRSIPARGVTLARVRVGGFEARDVEAAVLDASATNAPPLLGMSFLGQFRFEIDAGKGTLKLLKIDTQ